MSVMKTLLKHQSALHMLFCSSLSSVKWCPESPGQETRKMVDGGR